LAKVTPFNDINRSEVSITEKYSNVKLCMVHNIKRTTTAADICDARDNILLLSFLAFSSGGLNPLRLTASEPIAAAGHGPGDSILHHRTPSSISLVTVEL
jgi:hypothetical protein